jgi:transcriptional regulator with XRE-family HTH domain
VDLKQLKKDGAKQLYFADIKQNEIARILGISEDTVARWKKDQRWDDEKDRIRIQAESSEVKIRELIDWNLFVIKAKKDQMEKEYQDGEVSVHDLSTIDAKSTDPLIRLFSAIKSKEMTFADTTKIINSFLKLVETKNTELAKAILPMSDEFLQNILKGI